MTPPQVERLRWELTKILTPDDDLLVIPLCERCLEGVQCAHSVVKRPNWPTKPPGHKIV